MSNDRKILAVGALLIAMGGTLAAAPAPQAAGNPAELVEHVAGLQRSVDRLVDLLAYYLEHQEADLLLKRIELRERRLAPIEGELRKARREVVELNTQLDQLREMAAEEERLLRETIRDVDDDYSKQIRSQLAQLGRAISMEESRLEDLEMRVRDLEDELAEGREELEILDELLAELIQERGRR